LLEASFLIGKTMKPHNISEFFALRAAIEMVSIMHGKIYGYFLKSIPLTRDSFSVYRNSLKMSNHSWCINQGRTLILQCNCMSLQM
jgi:hypothetical protein